MRARRCQRSAVARSRNADVLLWRFAHESLIPNHLVHEHGLCAYATLTAARRKRFNQDLLDRIVAAADNRWGCSNQQPVTLSGGNFTIPTDVPLLLEDGAPAAKVVAGPLERV